VGLSNLVTLFSGIGANEEALAPFMISNVTGKALPEVMRGEIWRLLTPIFAHGGLMHIVFNMMWLWDLGAMIESRKGSLTLALLVVGVGVLSNLGQYFLAGPSFFGMSGVVYGLLGYAWMHTKFAPEAGLHIRQDTVWMMIVWFFLCLLGVVGRIANGAHAVGFGVGIAWGYVSARIAARRP
jgi:membrane associated rhomboid family serine protease